VTCIPLLTPGDTLYENPCQHVILVNFSYLASTLSEVESDLFTLLSCHEVCYQPCDRKGSVEKMDMIARISSGDDMHATTLSALYAVTEPL
jgi:hypothetical protein